MGATFIKKLPIPLDIKTEYPLDEALSEIKQNNDKEIKNIFEGKSDKLLLIIGPCSADNTDAVIYYIERLRKIYEKVADKIFIVPRVYTNKPRTDGNGYMGMLHQPNPNEKPDILKGIVDIRKLYIKILKDYGFVCADELLYPDNFRYWSDVLGYVTVGARSVENQQHRLTASGIEIPVGMKNPIGGDINVMINSIISANNPHTFIYRGWQVESTGNPLAHGILRGYVDKNGNYASNYSLENLKKVYSLFGGNNVKNKSVIVDTNHANSGKNPFLQNKIALDVLNSRKTDSEIKSFVKGLMIESYIEDGAQDINGTVFGKSITDPCLGIEKSENLILSVADSL